jgi:hypothetical protein
MVVKTREGGGKSSSDWRVYASRTKGLQTTLIDSFFSGPSSLPMTRKRNKHIDADAMDDGDTREQNSTTHSVAESLRKLGQPLPKLVAFDLE